jgi:hypothetical protein
LENSKSWSQVPESGRWETRCKILAACNEETSGDLGEISSYIADFSKVGYKWSKDDQVREVILKKIGEGLGSDILREKNTVYVPSILYQLGKAGVQPKSLPISTWEALKTSIGEFSGSLIGQDTSMVIYG